MEPSRCLFCPQCCGRIPPQSYLYVSVSGADSPAYGAGHTNLQEAINAATNGCTVWIEDGFVCNAGGTDSRIDLNKEITLRSVSGTLESSAVIDGTASVRCLYVTEAATVIGLQLTNGATLNYGGGAYLTSAGTGTMFSNCLIVANRTTSTSGGNGAGIYGGGTLRGCEIVNNETGIKGYGGGTYGSITAEYCRFAGNYAKYGGGTCNGTLSDCMIVSNSCSWAGGGAYSATLRNCALAYNKCTSQNGGGAYSCTSSDCVLTGNTASYNGAAIYSGSALRCVITNNANGRSSGCVVYNCAATQCLIQDNTFSHNNGGVVNGGSLINCLLTGNSANNSGGAIAYNTDIYNSTLADGAAGKAAINSTLINTIVWNNPSAGNDNIATNSCIDASAVASGTGNIDANPLFVASGAWPYRLGGGSPCIDKGLGGFSWMLPADPDTLGRDMSGRRRVIGTAVDLGAFEFMPEGTVLIVE